MLKTKQNKGNKRDIHKPVPEERPKDAAGEEKSANPPIRPALRKPQNIHLKQTSSGCHSTIVSIPSVSVVKEGGEGSGGRSVEHQTSAQCFHLLHSQGTAPETSGALSSYTSTLFRLLSLNPSASISSWSLSLKSRLAVS